MKEKREILLAYGLNKNLKSLQQKQRPKSVKPQKKKKSK